MAKEIIQEVKGSEKEKFSKTIVRALKGEYGANITLLLTLIVTTFVFSMLAPNFFKLNNMLNIARSIAITGVVAIGETFVIIAGGIDLSVTAIMAAAGMAAAVALRAGVPLWVGVVIAIAVGAAVGLINGLIVTKIRINPFITTLGTSQIVRGLAYISSAGHTLTVPVEGFSILGRGRWLDIIPYPVFILIGFFIIAHFFLSKTLAGRYIYAIGGNSEACRLAGINVDRWRLIFYSVCGVTAGFAGYMLASLVGSAQGNAALGAEMNVISGVILGGASLAGGEGTISGSFLGILLLGTLTNGLIQLNVPSFWQMVASGTVLMLSLFIDSWRSGGYK